MAKEKINEVALHGNVKELNLIYNDFFQALIQGNYSLCSALVRNCRAKHISIRELYENLFRKALYEVGELWEYNKISVATEHMASAIIESILNQLYVDIASKEKKGKTVIASCVENEYHQIGIKMICDIFEMNGWDALFLGSNIPTSELISFIKLKKPDMVALSLSLYFNLPLLEKMIQRIQSEFPGVPVLVGGQAFRHGGEHIVLKYENVVFLSDLKSTELYIKNYK